MDKYIKQSIDSRKQAIAATYEVSTDAQKKIDKLFAEIETLGAKCTDVGDFEAKFATSPLNQQYLDLFTEIATTSQAKSSAPKVLKASIGKAIAGDAAASVAEDAAGKAIDAALPTRASVHQAARDAAMGVPVLGDAIDIGQKASYAAHLGKLFGKKKKKKE
ncbi:MAG: hypothetical protein U0L97_04190 [Candidatus Saccharimonadaceae bacterium]|nr:hypothetical protein [Candidatus Saccharimonadaceae bacterium]